VALVAILLVLSTPAAALAKDEPDDDCGTSNLVFDFTCEVKDEIGDVATAPITYAAGSAVDTITAWVADSAQWLLGKVVSFIDDSTSPDLGASWFAERYRFMIGLAALVLAPMLLMAVIRAVLNQDLSQLLRSFFLYLPTAILGTFIAVVLAQTLLSVTDALSASVADGIGRDVSQIFDAVGNTLTSPVGISNPGAPSFAIFFGALLLVIGAFLVWLELLVRSAAVTVSVFFLPLMLAGLVWPATAHWAKRLMETLVALILSKFVIVAVISLATAALSDPGGGGFGTVMGGAALMLMAAFSPFALLKLMPAVEGAAVSHLAGMGRKPVDAVRRGGSANQALSVMRSKVSGGGGTQMAVAGAGGRSGAGVSAVGATAAAGVGATKATSKAAHAPGKRLDRTTGAMRSESSKPSGESIGGRVGEPSAKPRIDRSGSGRRSKNG
jgi:hypothetical protein